MQPEVSKSGIRNFFKEKRSELSGDEREELSLKIANKSLDFDIWNLSFYHIFLPIERLREVNTEYLLNILNGKDKNIVLGKVNTSGIELTNFLLTDNTTLKKNTWGIPEPQDGIEVDVNQLDVVFVPLLAFDIRGNRLGYGKGYYDNFLKKCRPDCLKIGVSFFDAIEKIPALPHDIALNACITADKIYQF
ncbi:MAG: 5-formyltetrahydrofolate cyclo-ligase [Leeuwenhoekiella sp.]